MSTRENALNDWLDTQFPNTEYKITPLAGDASARRYYRLHTQRGSHIVMDAPPEKINLTPFINTGSLLNQHGLTTPAIHGLDSDLGFVILDDFGDELFLQALSSRPADTLYTQALTTLAHMQGCTTTNTALPLFDNALILRELSLFEEWFLNRYLGIRLQADEKIILEDTYQWLAKTLLAQPQVFVHRDFHSRNILIMPDKGSNSIRLGLIDFQDAMIGPWTYDAVSLLKDCYVAWPKAQVETWLAFFYDQIAVTHDDSFSDFQRAFDLCGLQRHIRILGTFCRLHLRDHKSNYLADLPLTFHYVMTSLERYEELRPFYELVSKKVQPAFLSEIK